MKIINHLKAKSIAGQYIASALKLEINEDDYLNTIHQLARKKLTLLKHVNPPLLRKQKLLLFLVQKGFELDLSNKEVHALVK
jgi:SOS response regulatory protein OraA/RecX